MHACSAPLGNLSPCSCCLCLHYSAPLKTAQVLRMLLNHPLSVVGGHQPKYRTIGQDKQVIDQKYGSRPDVCNRPAISSCRMLFCCSRGQTEHVNAFARQCLHDHSPYHVMNSREYSPPPSDHQSHILMHDGQRSRMCNSIWNEMHKNTQEAPNLYHA